MIEQHQNIAILVEVDKETNHVFYKDIYNNEDIPVRVLEIKFKKENMKSVQKHWHRSVEIILPKQNDTQVWIEGKIKVAKENEFCFINSKQIYSCKSVSPQLPYHGYCIQINYQFIQ